MSKIIAGERRAQTRCTLHNLMYAIIGQDTHRVRVENISASGAAVATEASLEIGEKLSLISDILGLIPAVVVRQTDTGVALRFLVDEDRQREFGSYFLERQSPRGLPAAG